MSRTPAETDIVEEMVAARWRIRRMWTIEANAIGTSPPNGAEAGICALIW